MSLIEKYNALEAKEQRALKIAGIAILLFILYQFIYEPYQATISTLKNQVNYQANLHQWFKTLPKDLTTQQSQSTKISLSASQLLSATSSSLKQASLRSFKFDLQQSDGSEVQLTFKQVPYVKFIKWMQGFWQKYPLKIDELSISKTKVTGMVSISLRFNIDQAA